MAEIAAPLRSCCRQPLEVFWGLRAGREQGEKGAWLVLSSLLQLEVKHALCWASAVCFSWLQDISEVV